MSRHSPLGFLLSMVIEIAAVALIVSLLPRVDLHPKAPSVGEMAEAVPFISPKSAEPTIAPVSWANVASAAAAPLAREASYYQRVAGKTTDASAPLAEPRREPPPLIDSDPARIQYVENRLDRASQQLVNSVGSFVTNTANDLLAPPPPSGPPTPSIERSAAYYPPPAGGPSFPGRELSVRPAPAAGVRRPAAAANSFQPRPWMRY